LYTNLVFSNTEITPYKFKNNTKEQDGYVIPASSRFTAPRKKQIFVPKFPKTKEDYNNQMNKIILNPVANQEFLGMTYLYHADAIQYPLFNYQNI